MTEARTSGLPGVDRDSADMTFHLAKEILAWRAGPGWPFMAGASLHTIVPNTDPGRKWFK